MEHDFGPEVALSCDGGTMMRDNTRFCALNLPVLVPPRVPIPESPVHKRLRQGFARLENIQLVRNHRQDPRFEKAVEERIIWRELLDLELQDIDDHIERASFAGRGGAE